MTEEDFETCIGRNCHRVVIGRKRIGDLFLPHCQSHKFVVTLLWALANELLKP